MFKKYGDGKITHVIEAEELDEKTQKAVEEAKKSFFKVPRVQGTIPHPITGEAAAGIVMLRPASPGTGVIAGGAMRAVLESAGIHNVLARSKGSSNPHNVVKATISALSQLRDAHTVAHNRGVSLSKVFNG